MRSPLDPGSSLPVRSAHSHSQLPYRSEDQGARGRGVILNTLRIIPCEIVPDVQSRIRDFETMIHHFPEIPWRVEDRFGCHQVVGFGVDYDGEVLVLQKRLVDFVEGGILEEDFLLLDVELGSWVWLVCFCHERQTRKDRPSHWIMCSRTASWRQGLLETSSS